MNKSEKYPDVTLLNPEGSVMDTYTKRYLELGSRFYDLFKHDLKNYQNAIFMALDLYRIKNEERYLELVEEASQKSLEHIEVIKEIEPFVYSGGNLGFYSFYSCIHRIIEKYPDNEFELIGEDVYVFADGAFPKLFDLLIQVTLENDSRYKISFITSEFEENGLNKCSIQVDIHNFSVPGNTLEAILNEDANSVTGDMMSLTFYIAKMILYRYSGNLKLTESSDDKTALCVTFLSAENSVFQPCLKPFE
ncbi:hypothetical protein MmiEs2_04700 [Methanimicrococcus stummii]|uniref:Uncharacterized protein n=1 Tax=Methanimicrococcus stummii TaxID=3028294 RepID=A0AA96V9D4_9EURY|nr:hypothetical protein [Methanimicrococcus sp. Es2]WNY28286.1 hypothetical protein MmiEs2_04700 [Methanimicrococcus sp. Es2]